ncbi:HNH endonuclease family protein [Prescottella equi]|uniref:HNH endonuclease family protein n=1 Tax=Rhodococcus hoagii TaxID=43767 RepID=UPI0012FC1A72|nr:HNH endonuclease family protein [Prescottella equi]
MIRQIAAVTTAVLVAVGVGVAVKDKVIDAEPAASFTAPDRPTGPDAAGPSIEELITQLQVVDELPFVPGYDREKFGRAWDKGRGAGACDVRSDLLGVQLVNPTLSASTGCVVGGQLHDPYTGEVVEYRPGSGTVEVDHVVPLLVAWRSGAADWPRDRRVEFANDTEWNLLATSREANQAKQASTLGEWQPPDVAFQCEYAHNYLTVAAKYTLAVTTGDITTARTACTTE